MKKSSSGKKSEKGSAITSIGQLPFVIAEALVLVAETINDPQNGFDSVTVPLNEVAAKLDSVLAFIFGDDCNLAALKLTEGQREYLRYILEQFAKGEEIEMAQASLTIVSMV